MKTCVKCHKTKSLDDFYKNQGTLDKRASYCKECNNAFRRQYYIDNKERLIAHIKQWGKENPDKLSEQRKRTYLKHRDRYRSRRKVNTEIRAGRLERQPCKICGIFPTEAHHHDYSKPLDVVWLCEDHHLQAHGKGR